MIKPTFYACLLPLEWNCYDQGKVFIIFLIYLVLIYLTSIYFPAIYKVLMYLHFLCLFIFSIMFLYNLIVILKYIFTHKKK